MSNEKKIRFANGNIIEQIENTESAQRGEDVYCYYPEVDCFGKKFKTNEKVKVSESGWWLHTVERKERKKDV